MSTTAQSRRWSIRASSGDDAIVRRALARQGASLNEYVVRHAVSAAIDDLADRRRSNRYIGLARIERLRLDCDPIDVARHSSELERHTGFRR